MEEMSPTEIATITKSIADTSIELLTGDEPIDPIELVGRLAMISALAEKAAEIAREGMH